MRLPRAALVALIPLGSIACGGSVTPSAGNGSGRGAGDTGVSRDGGPVREAAARDAGVDCGQPAQPVYACPGGFDAALDGARCVPYGAPPDAPADAGFPLGCTVTLPTCDLSFGTPQTCNCETFPGSNDGGPSWICPL